MIKKHRPIEKHRNRSVLYISAIILCIDLLFVAINYYTSHKTLQNTLLQQAENHRNEFDLTLNMTYRNMLQLSTFISNNDELNQLFLAGKKAVEKEGMHSDKVSQLRKALLDKVKVPWDLTVQKFNVRQLHYQLGPGSLSYLRVHEPNRFGDRMDNTRFTIIDTNAEKTAHVGFETGRVYSGLRGVSPVWTTDPATNERTYVGAVEVGTSFKQILPLFAHTFNVENAVLLSKEHVKKNMWQSYVSNYFRENTDIDYYLEASSSDDVKAVLAKTTINQGFIENNTTVFEEDGRYFSSYYFPLFDYQGTKDNTLPPVGFVLIWEDVTPLIVDFNRSFWVNILFSIMAFILLEIFLLWILRKEKKLSAAKREALIDGLTGLYNRRFFDALLKKESANALKANTPLSMIICDIDFFKRFNDTYGHPQGDEGLKQVAHTIQRIVDSHGGVACRFGGEEFVVVLPYTNLKDAINLAESIRKSVSSLGIPHESSLIRSHLTLSLGVSCTHDSPSSKSLLDAADARLYQAKEKGRNRVEPCFASAHGHSSDLSQ
ncbi:diguanylate cyclase [Marinomonas algarum]|uniref:diguanylate cyclase n=1 Tax=Marinomonas algarum TaxID=2883105 RepID=A0A9X1LF19_9GAMM|nr:diguanylate cyclase [Marinomonas algarum]MCB5162358.1 diguanylate cyclase [Marinomonas algarum]